MMKKQHSLAIFAITILASVPALANDDLVFHSVTPCVVLDTRPAFGGTGPLPAEETRFFHVVGSTSDFTGQGGTAGGCGVPGFAAAQPVVQAVFINYVAINAAGGGQLKAWPGDQPEPDQGAVV